MTERKKKPSAKAHAQKVGAARYWAAYDAAMFVLKGDSRLVGLDKARGEMAHEAALRGTGFPDRPFNLSKRCGGPDKQMQVAVDEMLPQAIEAARQADFAKQVLR